MQALHEAHIVHYDLKMENVLLERQPGTTDEVFWHPEGTPSFKIVLCDFGESQTYARDESVASNRRGTSMKERFELRTQHMLPGATHIQSHPIPSGSPS